VSRFGVWYDGGGLTFGWLAEEHNHGRQYTAEYSTLEEAEQAAAHERFYDKTTVFYAARIDSDREALFKYVRKLWNRRRLTRAERELVAAKTAVNEDDEKIRAQFERALDDDPSE
jgi:hypothetical protein